MVKIGIIGVGRVAVNKHISGIKSAGNAKITAICDIDEEKLKTVGYCLKTPEKHRFTDYNGLISCAEVETVEICTPNYLHVRMATAAAKAGKPVEVEKPLGISMKDGLDELVKAVKDSGIVNMMNFTYRFMDAARYAKSLIEKGKLGKIVNVNIEYLQSGAFIPGRRLEWRRVRILVFAS